MKRRVLLLTALLLPMFLLHGVSRADEEEDPFAGGEDALAVAADDGSSSLRAKLKLTKMEDDMVMVRVVSVDDSKYPNCVLKANVLKAAVKKDGFFKLLGKGKEYRFVPELKLMSCGCKKKKKCKSMTEGRIDLKDDATQSNLGACYYPIKTKLVIKVGGVDLKAKVFKAAAIYLK